MNTQTSKLLRLVFLLLFAAGSTQSANAGNDFVYITYYHNDLQGSPVAATNEDGEIIWREEYKPYGERLLDEDDSALNRLWYTGKAHDEASSSSRYAGGPPRYLWQ